MLNSESFVKVPFILIEEMLNFLFGMKGYSHNRQKKRVLSTHFAFMCG